MQRAYQEGIRKTIVLGKEDDAIARSGPSVASNDVGHTNYL